MQPTLADLQQLLATTPTAVYCPAAQFIVTRTRTQPVFTLPAALEFTQRLAALGYRSHVLVYGVEWRG